MRLPRFVVAFLLLSVVPLSTQARSFEDGPRPLEKADPATPTTLGATTLPIVNACLIAFCKHNLGQKVGNGECAELAQNALKTAGSDWRLSESPGQGDYVWGKCVFYREVVNGKILEGNGTGPNEALLPGDIVQFRDAVFRYRKGRTVYSDFAPHHTAVIATIANQGRIITMFEQNPDDKKGVVESPLHLSDLKQGWVRVYRPTMPVAVTASRAASTDRG